MGLSNKAFHLIVFFTFNVSLKKWVETGLIGRELILYKKMVRQGNRVTLLTYGNKEDHQYSDMLGGIEVLPVYAYFQKSENLWMNLVISFFIPFKFRQLFGSADFLKTNQMFGSWVPVIASILFSKPLIARCGFEMLRNLLRDEKRRHVWMLKAMSGYFLELIIFCRARKIIISNLSDINFIKRLYPIQPDKIRLIRNFIDTDCFSPKVTSYCDISNQNSQSILFIGRLDDNRKNIINLFKAVGKSGCSLTIVGTGKLKAYFEKQANQIGCSVNFLGVVDNRKIPEIIRDHDLFILPSFYENNPKTLLEAMACERICIGTNVEGIKELIEDGVTGYLCETNSESIALTIKKIIRTDSDYLKQIAKNARMFVINECSIENVYKKEIELYKCSLGVRSCTD